LHGLATAPPAGASVASCIEKINAAGECAKGDPETPLAECETAVPEARFRLNTACDVVLHPERAAECAFLTDVPPEEGAGGTGSADDEPAAAGQAGTTNDTSQAGTPAE
jgi:hypothetical protein